jgi:hypothetical protein
LYSFIVQNSPNLNNTHIRLFSQGQEAPFYIFAILDYEFKRSGGSITMPALRALAAVDCKYDYWFYQSFQPELLPGLRALMLTNTDCMSADRLSRFLAGLNSLRELVVSGRALYSEDNAWLSSHEQFLELLALHQEACDLVSIWTDSQSVFSSQYPNGSTSPVLFYGSYLLPYEGHFTDASQQHNVS